MEPVNGINKDVCGAKLQPMTVSAYPVDCDCLCHLLNTHYCCLCLNRMLNQPAAAHPPPPPNPPPSTHPSHPLLLSHPLIRAIHNITVAMKMLLKLQQC